MKDLVIVNRGYAQKVVLLRRTSKGSEKKTYRGITGVVSLKTTVIKACLLFARGAPISVLFSLNVKKLQIVEKNDMYQVCIKVPQMYLFAWSWLCVGGLYLCSSKSLFLKGWRRIHRRLDCSAWNLEADATFCLLACSALACPPPPGGYTPRSKAYQAQTSFVI